MVSVMHDDRSPAPTELAMVSGAGFLEADFPDEHGMAGFVAPPGDSTIEIDGRPTAVTVQPSNTRFVQMHMGT